MKDTRVRDILREEIKKDSVGPYEIDETFAPTERPQSRYFSGVLFPIQTPVIDQDGGDDMQNGSTVIKSSDDPNDDTNEKIPINVGTKLSSMGLTCNVSLDQKLVNVDISYGRFVDEAIDDILEGKFEATPSNDACRNCAYKNMCEFAV